MGPPDNTPPVISDIVVTDVSDTTATVTWATDEEADSAVDYGLTTLYGSVVSNATLTVREGQAGSHQKQGWETFTNRVIETVSTQKNGLVFLLWGRYAQAKENLIEGTRHLVLKSAHPSPLSARNGFFGCRHFSRTNVYLEQQGMTGIDWSI